MHIFKLVFLFISLILFGSGHCAWAAEFKYLPDMESVQLKPRMRQLPYSAAIYSVLSDDLFKLIQNVLIYDTLEEYQSLPYVISFGENRSVAHEGELAYTKGIDIRDDYFEYSLLRHGKTLIHPETKEQIGVEAFVNGRAIVQKFGDPQTIQIKESLTSVEINARLIPLVGIDLPSIIDVKYPSRPMTGYILSIEDDLSVGGAYMPVTISLGSVDCLKLGNVLDLVEKKIEVTDPNKKNKIKLPLTKIGEVMVYKVGKRISLGIITYSDRSIVVGDKLTVIDHGF